MGIKTIVENHLNNKRQELIKTLDEIKSKGKSMGHKRGLLYFSRRAPHLMNKIDNLDRLRNIIKKMKFIEDNEIEKMNHSSKYGTYCYKDEFYYGSKLINEEEDTIKQVVINEIIYSMLKPTARATDTIVDYYVRELPHIYYALGLIYPEEDLGLVTANRRLVNDKLDEKIMKIIPNKESIKRRYKRDKKEDNIISYYEIQWYFGLPEIAFVYEYTDIVKGERIENKVRKMYTMTSSFLKDNIDYVVN